MRKRLFVLLPAFLMVICSCNNGQQQGNAAAQNGDSAARAGNKSEMMVAGGSEGDSFCTFIPKDSANKMITSYLNSINYTSNDSDLRSIIIDVKTLTEYLAQTTSTGAKAVKIKLMFAHTLKYINDGNGNRNCGYQSGKLTFVIATYDSAGNYILMNGNSVLERLQPCPTNCPISGNAAGNLIQ